VSLEIPDSLFGVPLAMRRADAEQLVAALGAKWQSQMRHPPRTLERDLELLKVIFNPTARGSTVRRIVVDLPQDSEVRSRFLRPPLVLGSGEARAITPEGRIVLEIVRVALEAPGDVVVLEPDSVYAAEHRAYVLYRDLSTTRLRDVLSVSEGRESLRLPSIAAVLLLLVNGSTTSDQALRRLPEARDQERLDGALSRVGLAFWDALEETGQHDARAFSLYSGYAWTEAARRFPRAVATNPWYVRGDNYDELLRGLVSELSRPHRYISSEAASKALKSLIDTYQREQSVLAGLGMSHYRAVTARRLQERLEEWLGQRPERV
jgi:hypothetical protein